MEIQNNFEGNALRTKISVMSLRCEDIQNIKNSVKIHKKSQKNSWNPFPHVILNDYYTIITFEGTWLKRLLEITNIEKSMI